MKILVELEFDAEELGEDWMNKYNLDLLLYGDARTKPHLLKVDNFKVFSEADEEDDLVVIL